MRCKSLPRLVKTSSERINRPVQNPRQLLHFLQPMVALYLHPARVTRSRNCTLSPPAYLCAFSTLANGITEVRFVTRLKWRYFLSFFPFFFTLSGSRKNQISSTEGSTGLSSDSSSFSLITDFVLEEIQANQCSLLFHFCYSLIIFKPVSLD